MFKSIFSKYFTVLSVIIIVSFAAMGGMQVLLSSRYWVADKRELLGDNVDKFAAKILADAEPVGVGSYEIGSELTSTLREWAEVSRCTLLITDASGRILVSTDVMNGPKVNQVLPEAVMNTLAGTKRFFVGDLGGLYPSRQYIALMPLYFENNGSQPLGYVLVSDPAARLNDTIKNNLQVFFLSALGVLTLTFIALYAMTYRMVRPLRQMARAARSFGMGDFSCRIPVTGKDEVAELASSLNNMAVSLSSVEGMRRSFVANVSHELKTPMTTIAGFIDGILDGTIPDEKRNYYLKIVSDEVKRLSRLVKSMLDLSRIDNGELKLNPVRFDLTEVACSVLLSFEQRIEAKNIAVEGMEDCDRVDVNGDYDLIGQVVYNLLDNAIKFTNENGTLTLRTERRDGRAYCTVRNTGIGIPANEMPHIFERFYKSDKSRSLDKNGVGLGLYIVKTVISLHHGEIVVRSTEGEYCEFAFWLPDPDAALPLKGHEKGERGREKSPDSPSSHETGK